MTEATVQHHSNQLCVTQLCVCSGPVLALALARRGAVARWRNMLGPAEVSKAKEENPER